MIVGEAEVQGQVKRPYELALVEEVTGPVSNRLSATRWPPASACAPRGTAITRSSYSVSSVAVQLAADFLGDLRQPAVEVIGAGETRSSRRALAERESRRCSWQKSALRARPRAGAALLGPRGVLRRPPAGAGECGHRRGLHGRPHQILGRDELEFVAASRMGRPLVLLDLAVPRDIDPAVRGCPRIALHDMDDLQRAVARNIGVREAGRRRRALSCARTWRRFQAWLSGLEVVPVISRCAAGPTRSWNRCCARTSPPGSPCRADRERRRDGTRGGDVTLRADPAPEGLGRRRRRVSVRTRSTTCSASKRRSTARRRRHKPLRAPPQAGVIGLGTRGSTRADAGALGGRTAPGGRRWSRSRPRVIAGGGRRPLRQEPLRQGARGCAARRHDRPRGSLRQGCRGPAARRAGDRGRA